MINIKSLKFNDLISKLRNQSKYMHGVLIVLALLEIVCTIIIGILSKNYEKELVPQILLFVGILYLIFAAIRLLHLRNFPASITDELESERKLNAFEKESNRLNTLSDVHVETMKNLNVQTCRLDENDDSSLCDFGITDSLAKLIKPLIDKSYYLLNTDKGIQFTYGLYLAGYKSLDKGTLDRGVVPISDGLGLNSYLKKDLFKKQDLDEDSQQIQNALKLSYNSRKFKSETIELKEKKMTIICSPMYEACREDDEEYHLLGVLFIICPFIIMDKENDIEVQLKIFNRIIANWMYSFNSCITGKKKSKING